jgi:hypothetical protein
MKEETMKPLNTIFLIGAATVGLRERGFDVIGSN